MVVRPLSILYDMKSLPLRSLLLPLSVLGVFALVTWPVWRWLWGEWMQNEYYSHGLVVVPLVGYLAWRRWRTAAQGNAEAWAPTTGLRGALTASGGWALFAAGLVFYLAALFSGAYWLAALAMIVLLAGIAWALLGGRLTRQLAFPLAFLVFMVPLPFVEAATLPLARFTGVCSTAAIRALGLNVQVAGSEVTLPGVRLVIGAQCSGISSSISLLALATLLAYVLQGPLWARLLIVLSAVPLAMLGNIARVANLMWVADSLGVDAAFKFYHDWSGYVTFAAGLVILLFLTRLLGCRTLRSEVL